MKARLERVWVFEAYNEAHDLELMLAFDHEPDAEELSNIQADYGPLYHTFVTPFELLSRGIPRCKVGKHTA